MTKLINALRTNDTRTENGMLTNSTTLNDCVDLFFHIGAMRGQDKQKKINAFVKAFSEDSLTAMKILFWVRDIRGGAGERQTFRDIMLYLVEKQSRILKKNMALIPEYGRWDDLLIFIGTKVEKNALNLIADGLDNDSTKALVAKWMPRPATKNKIKKMQANVIRKHLGMSPKEYRKMLVELSDTVEQKMCAKEWDDINFAHVPSKAMSDYMKAFRKNNPEGFQAYMDSLEKSETKINAGAVYPYDITKNLTYGDSSGADAQWDALPNFMENNDERVLPVVDVSASMNTSAGGNPNVTCMDISVSLGIYISERNVGPFKDAFVTFSQHPEVQVLKGRLSDRYSQLKRSDWSFNTNLQAVFEEVLRKARTSNVPEDEMPTMIMVLSDMQFDEGTGNSWNDTAQAMIEKKYREAGYNIPKVVYWNLRSVESDSPVQFNKQNVALVSGFSPSLLTNILSGGAITPYSMMMDVIGSERYAKITV